MDNILVEAIEAESLKLGIDLKLLATKLAVEYKRYFTPSKLYRMNFNKLDTFNDTKLDLTKNTTLTIAEKKILNFNDIHKLNYDHYTYLLVNLKEAVKKLIINSKQINLMYNFNIYDITKFIKENYGIILELNEYEEYKKELYIKSLVYNYTYLLLFNGSKKEHDYVIAGMFKNAYFDIISIYENTLDKKKTL